MTRQQRSAFLRQPVLTVDDRRIITAVKVLERDKAVPASALTTDGQEVTTRKEVTVLTAALAHHTSPHLDSGHAGHHHWPALVLDFPRDSDVFEGVR